jgi:PAS domain S-box-containing protein
MPNLHKLFSGNGAVRAMLREHDWSNSPLGDPETWSPALRTIVSLMLDSRFPMYVAWGPDLILLYNDGYAEILGAKHPKALGAPFWETWPEVFPIVGPVIDRALGGEATFSENVPMRLLRHGHEEQTWFTFSVSPARDQDGSIAGVYTVCSETTGQVLAERDRLAENERLRRLFEQAPGFMTVLRGPEHVFELINAAYLQLVGHRNLIGKTVRDALPEVEDQVFFKLLHQVYTTGKPFVGRGVLLKVQREPGSEPVERVVNFIYQPIFDVDGKVSGIFVEGSDITEQRRTENALRDLNETLEQRVAHAVAERDLVWRTTQDLIVISGSDGLYRSANPAWFEALGYTQAELVGIKFDTLAHSDDVAKAGKSLEQLNRGIAVRDVDIRMRHKDGTYRWYSWQCTPEGDQFGAAGRDITHRRQLEEQLRQSHKMEAIGQLTGGIAHDFNNLLAGMLGNLEIMRFRVAQGRVTEIPRYIEAAIAAANRSAALTHRLLAFSRQQTLDPKAIGINMLVKSMEDLINRTVGPSIQVSTALDNGLWTTLCDPNQLESALLNLAINARDAMPDGGRISIETSNTTLDEAYARAQQDVAPGHYVTVSVSDNGTGIPPDVLDRVFDPFFTTKPMGQGTGLGLSMVYGFVKQSRGHIRIFSKPGHGTTVQLYLPKHVGEVIDNMIASNASVPPPIDAGATVLLVDDESSLRTLLAEILKELGYVVIESTSGHEGMQVLESPRRIDLLVTDIGLPSGMNGWQLADAGRKRRPGLKILFITGFAESTATGGLLAAGEEIMAKPFSIGTFAAKVNSMIDA